MDKLNTWIKKGGKKGEREGRDETGRKVKRTQRAKRYKVTALCSPRRPQGSNLGRHREGANTPEALTRAATNCQTQLFSRQAHSARNGLLHSPSPSAPRPPVAVAAAHPVQPLSNWSAGAGSRVLPVHHTQRFKRLRLKTISAPA